MSNHETRDVAEIRAVIQQIYTAISGPAGPRDWALAARSFVPEGRMVVVHKENDGGVRIQPLTVDDYERTRAPYFGANAFYENETHADVQIVGNLAQCLSYYESRRDPAEKPFDSGVNLVQLVRTPAGWRVVATMWEAGKVAAQLQS